MSAPDFQLVIDPAETIQDTKLTVSGCRVGTTYPYYYRLAKAWVAKNRPHWGKHWGVESGLRPSKQIVQHQTPSVHTNPIALAHHCFDNSESSIPATCHAELHSSITNTSSIDWNTETEKEIDVGVEVGGSFAKVTAGVSYMTEVGKDVGKSKTLEIGSSDEVEVTLPEHGILLAVLYLKQCTIKVDCELQWLLQGALYFDGPSPQNPGGDGGPGAEHITVKAEELQEYLVPWEYQPTKFTLSVEFSTSSEIKTVSLEDASDKSVKAAIDDLLGKKDGDYEWH